jgi:hypothetical protein
MVSVSQLTHWQLKFAMTATSLTTMDALIASLIRVMCVLVAHLTFVRLYAAMALSM